jgi:hypothetical protein
MIRICNFAISLSSIYCPAGLSSFSDNVDVLANALMEGGGAGMEDPLPAMAAVDDHGGPAWPFQPLLLPPPLMLQLPPLPPLPAGQPEDEIGEGWWNHEVEEEEMEGYMEVGEWVAAKTAANSAPKPLRQPQLFKV